MALNDDYLHWLASAWGVLVLFLIPIGGGIPAGVMLARAKGIEWPAMAVLYFISDVILACIFEPLLLFVVFLGKRSPGIARFNQNMKVSMGKSISKYGVKPGPITLILISFGIDPMTGRSAALASGHSFVSGWTLAIVGDMGTFAILMASTLWLSKFLGDGTWTVVIITVAMLVIPALFRKIKEWRSTKAFRN